MMHNHPLSTCTPEPRRIARGRRRVAWAMLALLPALPWALPARAAGPPTTAPEIRRGMEMGGTPEQRASRFFDAVIRHAEPDGRGKPERLEHYLEFFGREFVREPRLFAVSLHAEAGRGGIVRLSGYSEYPEHVAAATTFLNRLGFDQVENSVETLPSADVRDRSIGIVTKPCFLCDKPPAAGRRENLTQCVSGDLLFLLKEVDGAAFLCHGPDGYVGFIDADTISRVNARGLMERMAPPPRDERIEQVIATASTLMGTKYVWGGTTADGVDCSGLVQRAFQSIGVQLARDADQQALAGRLVATRSDRTGLERGDLLYFISRRGSIHHTAIYLGDQQFLEAANPGVKISSFRPGEANYEPRRDASFAFAKRLLIRPAGSQPPTTHPAP